VQSKTFCNNRSETEINTKRAHQKRYIDLCKHSGIFQNVLLYTIKQSLYYSPEGIVMDSGYNESLNVLLIHNLFHQSE